MKRFTSLQTIPEIQTIEGSFRPHYEYQWPADLPSHCEICGNEFRVSENLQFGPKRSSVILKKISLLSILASTATLLLVVAPVAMLNFNNSYIDIGITLIAVLACFVFMAAPVLFFISIFSPDIRHLNCNKCSWNRDYRLQKTQLKLSK
ncbi:MAG: hypothetical protein ACK56K_01750 [Akkermansiaceae bacterium]|nr:hypothetical protein [Luteolibacter sp.]